jgi:hypothetical protein
MGEKGAERGMSPSEYVNGRLSELDDKLALQQILVNSLPARLFHYTDAAGLKGILQSERLFATDLRFMNDSGELFYARNLISEVTSTELSSQPEPLSKIFHQVFELLEVVAVHAFYAACFCEEGDVLSQWRAYGNGGGGYAIGFDTAALISNLMDPKGWSIFRKVDYDPDSQRERIRSILQSRFSICNQCSTKFPEHPELESALRRCASHAIRSLFWEFSCMKNPLFSEEKEWRVVEFVGEPSNFRLSRSGLLVPYIELSYDGSERKRRAVAELRWGPTLTPELARLSLDALIESLGYKELTIRGSMIPLRA